MDVPSNLPEFTEGGLSLRFADPAGTSCFGMCLHIGTLQGAADAVSFLIDLGESVGDSIIVNILYAERDAGTAGFEEVGSEGHSFDDIRKVSASGTIHTFEVSEGLLVDVFAAGPNEDWAYLIAGLSRQVVAQVFPALANHIENISDGEWSHASEAIRELLPEERAEPDDTGHYVGAVIANGSDLPDTAEFLRKLGTPDEEIESVQESQKHSEEVATEDEVDLDWD